MNQEWIQEDLPLEDCCLNKETEILRTENQEKEAFLSCPCLLCVGLRKMLDIETQIGRK